MTPEKKVVKTICEYLELRGFYFWVNDSVGIFDPTRGTFRKRRGGYYKKGVSDILGILPGGRFLAIEVKSKTGRLTPEQKVFLEDINSRGGLAFLARSLDDVIAALAS